MPTLSIVIIAKNEVNFLEDCLKSCLFADEIILLDGGSTDGTLQIASKYKVKIVKQEKPKLDFAAWHNQGQQAANMEWVFFLDADERLTPTLVSEIKHHLANLPHSAYAVPRYNYLLNRKLLHGDWYPDYQTRLFCKNKLKYWVGELHEHAMYDGTLGYLNSAMIHLQPSKIEPALQKSIRWSQIEAQLLFEAKHPPVVWWRVIRMGLTTIYYRLLKKQGYKDGVEGWIESIYQSFHTMMIYLRLYEKQQI